MADEVWPENLGVNQAFARVQNRSGVFDSPFALGGQVASRYGALRWVSEVSFSNLSRRNLARVQALIGRAEGAGRVILVPDFERQRPMREINALNPGGLDDTISASEAGFSDTGLAFADTGFNFSVSPPFKLSAEVSQSANSFSIAGFIPGVLAFYEGQTFSVDNRLYRVIDAAPVVADETGVVTVTTEPRARHVHEAGAPVILSLPVCRMRLAPEDYDGKSSKIFSNLTLRFAEAPV